MVEEKIKKAFKHPKSMGACADKLYELKKQMSVASAAVKAIEEEYKSLKTHIIDNLDANSSGAIGKTAKVQILTKEAPTVSDYDAFYRHVKKTGNFGLLQKRLTESVIQEIWDEGKEVPGVEHFKYKTVSINKL